jgi:hypothetical protein
MSAFGSTIAKRQLEPLTLFALADTANAHRPSADPPRADRRRVDGDDGAPRQDESAGRRLDEVLHRRDVRIGIARGDHDTVRTADGDRVRGGGVLTTTTSCAVLSTGAVTL